jgi:hypothetical protein
MNEIGLKKPPPAATGFHWLSGLLSGAADRIEQVFETDAGVSSQELYFDSDAYLAHLKNRIYTQYY